MNIPGRMAPRGLVTITKTSLPEIARLGSTWFANRNVLQRHLTALRTAGNIFRLSQLRRRCFRYHHTTNSILSITMNSQIVFYLNMVWFPVYLQEVLIFHSTVGVHNLSIQTAGPAAALAGTISVAVFALILIPIAGCSIDYVNPYFVGMLARFSTLFYVSCRLFLLIPFC